jgi:hypothetical protein
MQDEVVSTAQVTRVRDDLICVLNASVLCYAPVLVTNDSVTVPTGRIRAVLVAIAQRRLVFYGHWLLLRQWLVNRKRRLVCLRTLLVSFINPAARSVSPLTLLDCTFRANLNLRAMGGISGLLVLINKDIRTILVAPEEVHRMAVVRNTVEQVQPL